MPQGIFLFSNTGQLEEELVLTSSFSWIALSGGEILSDYVDVNHEPVLVQDRLKGVDDPDFLLFCVSNLFDAAGVNRSQVTFEKLREHPEAEVTFNQYLLDLVLFADESELFKIRLAVTSPKAAARQQEKVSVQVGDYCITELVRASAARVNTHDDSGVLNKLRSDLCRLVEQITVKAYGR